ncbi:uncharacterized protein LOC135339613 isoform X2 [Halichondria panicea]|uniref:uncharacterized protein LOC135339613 isoform X2 n=1 Tax=Halichondria panicea TaxID=6063 RepID=UPI00312B6B1C
MSVGVSGNNFTSILTLIATIGLNGMTIECTRSGTVIFGNDTLRSGARLSPPQRAMVDITSTSSLTVSWTPPSDTSNLEGYLFTVTGENCGCESMNISSDTTSVSCSGWMVNNQTCSFEVRTVSQDCGFTSAPVNEYVVLMVPPAPTQLRVVFSAYKIEVEFMQAILSPLGSNLDSTISYTVMVVGTNFSINFTGVICDNNRCNLTIPNSQLSTYNVSYMYIVSVVASNIFGFGPSAVYVECNPEDLGNSTFLNGLGKVNVSNGLIHYSGVSPDSIAMLRCNDGYRANSFLNRTCMFDGQWSEGALECVRVDGKTVSPRITPACPLYCAVLVGVFVSVTVVVLIIVCIAIALYILKKYGRERFASINMSEKVQYRANLESPNTNESSLSLVDTQPSKAKINVNSVLSTRTLK